MMCAEDRLRESARRHVGATELLTLLGVRCTIDCRLSRHSLSVHTSISVVDQHVNRSISNVSMRGAIATPEDAIFERTIVPWRRHAIIILQERIYYKDAVNFGRPFLLSSISPSSALELVLVSDLFHRSELIAEHYNNENPRLARLHCGLLRSHSSLCQPCSKEAPIDSSVEALAPFLGAP